MKPEFRNQKSGVGVAPGLWPDSIGAPRRRYNFAWLVFLLLSFGIATLHAQSYSIDWFTIDGGGGTSTGGVYAVSGTLGQPDAGLMSGGGYSLAGGFWSGVVAIATPGAPLLTIEPQPDGSVRVAWPAPATGFVIEQASALATLPAVTAWTPVSASYQTNAAIISIIAPAPAGNRFYRLRHP